MSASRVQRAFAAEHPQRSQFSHKTAARQADGSRGLRLRCCAANGTPTVVGVGGVGIDYLASVATFPQADMKMRTEALEIQGGGNCGNALTGLARLGVHARVLSTIGADPLGDRLMEEFERDNVSTEYLQRMADAPTPFTYIIVDKLGAQRRAFATVRMAGQDDAADSASAQLQTAPIHQSCT